MRSILLISVAALSLLSGQAIAGLATHRAHGDINQIIDFSETDASPGTNSTSWVDVPHASFDLIVPAGADQLVMAHYTAESTINGPATEAWCTVRIMAGNAEMTPNSGSDYAFQTNVVTGVYQYVGGALERSIVLHPGTYVIKVQYATNDATDTCYLDDWHLNVMTADNGP